MAVKRCPVCDWEIKDGGKSVKVENQSIVVCCDECAEKVKAEPQKYVKKR